LVPSGLRQSDKPRPGEGIAEAVEYVILAAPRILNVAAMTAISFGLWDGANRVLSDAKNVDDDIRRRLQRGEVVEARCGAKSCLDTNSYL
jgi:hypothetical protein